MRTRAAIRWLLMGDVCKQCVQAGCLEVCPTGAIIRSDFDTVVIQPDVCNGCRYCIVACPFDAIGIEQATNTAMKCTLCYDRRQIHADLLSLAYANLWLIGSWLLTVAQFLLTLVGSTGAGRFLTGLPLVLIVAAMVLAGIVPLAVARFRPLRPAIRLSLSSVVVVLVGSFLVRYAIVTAPQVH